MPMSSLQARLGLARAARIAASQSHIASRRQLYAEDVPRWLVRRELRVGRWQRTGRQTVALHNGPLDHGARQWVAVLELGPRAALDGVSSLQHAGLTSLTDVLTHVIVPRGTRRLRLPGVALHESRRWREEDVLSEGLRRTRPAVAAVHAALWASTERQAAFFLTVAVQQSLCSVPQLVEVLESVRRHRWRRLLWDVAGDLTGGVRSVGELDLARGLRRRGLPEPVRQTVRHRPDGSVYRDAEFPSYGLVLESDGSQHDLPWARLADTLRDLDEASDGLTVLRIPLLAWRLDEERVLDRLEAVFRSRGWRPQAA